MRTVLVGLFVGLFAWPQSVLGSQQPKTRVAVLTFEAKLGFAAEKAEMLTMFVEDAIRTRGFDVVGKGDIDAILGLERMKDMVGCDDAGCMAEIGGALGVDEVVHGAIGKMGTYLLITAKRIDIRKARVLQQATKKFKDGGDESLLDAISPLVTKLFGEAPGTHATATPIVPQQERSRQRTTSPGVAPGPSAKSSPEADRTATPAVEAHASAGSVGAGIPLLPAALVGAGSIGLLAAGYLQVVAWKYHQNATDEDYDGRQVEADSGSRSQTFARLTAGAGLVVAATGAVLWWMRSRDANGEAVSLSVTSDETLVAYSGRF